MEYFGANDKLEFWIAEPKPWDVVFEFDKDGLSVRRYCSPTEDEEKCNNCQHELKYKCFFVKKSFQIKGVYIGGAMILEIDEDSEVLLSGAVLKAVLDNKLDEPEKATLERWIWMYRVALDKIQECKEDFGKRYWSVFIRKYGKQAVSDKVDELQDYNKILSDFVSSEEQRYWYEQIVGHLSKQWSMSDKYVSPEPVWIDLSEWGGADKAFGDRFPELVKAINEMLKQRYHRKSEKLV